MSFMRAFALLPPILLALPSAPAWADTAAIESALNTSMQNVEQSPIGFTSGNFVLAPIPISNPTVETGLALGGGYLFKLDDNSATSFVGLGGFKTTNGTNGVMIGGSLNFGNGDWKITGMFGEALFNYDFYGVGSGDRGIGVPFEQTGRLAVLRGSYQVFENFYAGLHFRYVDTDVKVRLSELDFSIGDIPIKLPDISKNFQIGLVGPTLEYDSRDDTIYPTHGHHLSFTASQGFSPEDDTLDYQTYVASYTHYTPVFKKNVIATRLSGCTVGGEVPFFDLCVLGGFDAFRGYPTGQFLDRNLISVQSEFRGDLFWRLGYALFAGVGTLSGDSDNLGDSLQVAGGAGLRLRVSKDFGLDLAIDAAVTPEGNVTSYVYVGQRF